MNHLYFELLHLVNAMNENSCYNGNAPQNVKHTVYSTEMPVSLSMTTMIC